MKRRARARIGDVRRARRYPGFRPLRLFGGFFNTRTKRRRRLVLVLLAITALATVAVLRLGRRHDLHERPVRVTIPEGFNRFQIAERLDQLAISDAADFIAATEDQAALGRRGLKGPSFEGYLFPDTYEFRTNTDAHDAVAAMHADFERRTRPLFKKHAAALAKLQAQLDFDARDVLVLASIVEREAAHPSELATISGVFLNRLRSKTFRPKRLDSDPTVSYGCLTAPTRASSCTDFDGQHITRAMLRDTDNPYNTRRIEGLPPGPISNPGLRAIAAVLNAEHHNYYYFVAKGGRRHHFSKTRKEHEAAVRSQPH